MIRFILPTILCFSMTVPALAAEPAVTLNVWPGLPPGDKPDLGKEQFNERTVTITGVVTTPTLAVYRPAKEKDTGAAVLVCPGGGFFQLSMGHEGADVATWLNSIGVTGIVLKYRIPSREGMPRYMAALQDAQRSMSIIRAKASAWGIDPKRVGILGFSAGGQMAADVETNFDKRMYEPIDAIDQFDTRPDFAVLMYPGGIIDKNSEVPNVTPDVKIRKDAPPTFLAIATDDRNGPENAVYMYLALKKAGVNAELHVYSEGGHGFGIRPGTAPHATWPARVTDWMTQHRFLSSSPTTRPAN